jgi:RCC1 and BTB domain-containing protein
MNYLWKFVMNTSFCFQELEEFCFKFCLNHMTAVVQTEGFISLEEQTVKNFIRKAAIFGVFKS